MMLKKLFAILTLGAVAFSASAALFDLSGYSLDRFRNPVKGQKVAHSETLPGKMEKSIAPEKLRIVSMTRADSGEGLEGTWTFNFGDYYFDDSVQGTIQAEFECTLEDGYLYFEDPNNHYWPFVAVYAEKESALYFPEIQLGTAPSSNGITYQICQIPFSYNWNEGGLEYEDQIIGEYDSTAGTITFEMDQGVVWAAVLNGEIKTIMDAYDFESAVKTDGSGSGSGSDDEDSWIDVGDATFMDGWVMPAFGLDQAENQYKVPLQKNSTNENLYRLVDPYHLGPIALYNESKKTGYIVFDVSDPEHVVFNKADAGFSLSDLGITTLYCYNTLGMYVEYFGISPEEVLEAAVASNIAMPFTTFREGVVTLNSIIDKGEIIYDANFGYQGDPDGGYGWQDQSNQAANMDAMIIFPGATGVETIISDKEDGCYYNLQGVKVVDAKQGDVNSLAPGIYIHNGKKILVK